jgi:hypothetical protein
MRASILILLTVTVMLTLGGCAAPRWLGLYVRSQTDLPIYPGGKQVKVHVQPSVVLASPGWSREIDVPQGVEEARAWYDKIIRGKGWNYTTFYICSDGTVGRDYARTRCLGSESLDLEIRLHEGRSRVTLKMSGGYWWELPSWLPFIPFYWALGESDQAIAIAKWMSWL